MMNPVRKVAAACLFLLLFVDPCRAAVVEYDLTIAREKVNITGKPVPAMTINGTIPGPVLRFREGDIARIRVHNAMNEETSIHWHGLLVPSGMDGVPYLSFPPIMPGATFTYEFPLRQSGTYWYHSHTGFQEQSGVYGSIAIEPVHTHISADREYVVHLSDWTDEDPGVVNRTLKRGSEWYALRKGSGQSLLGAARLGKVGDFFLRELQRMPPMDIADVAYDRFLANGTPETTLDAGPGETLRLRMVNGSSTTYFYLEFAGSPMTITAADGQDVEPVLETRFLVAAAETYDLLVWVPDSGAWELRATSHDGSGSASVWIGSGERHPAPDIPRSNLYHPMGHLSLGQLFSLTPAGVMGMPDRKVEAGRFDKPGMMGMGAMNHGSGATHGTMEGMNHGAGTSHDSMAGMDHGGVGGAEVSPHDSHDTAVPPEAGSGVMEHSGHTMPVSVPPSAPYKDDGPFGLLAEDAAAYGDLAIDGGDSRPWPPYGRLRGVKSTAFPADRPVRDIRLTLDGDMERYVWFMNNEPLSHHNTIRVRGGEITRFILVNRTMMHHPMHLHGHFFRVINGQGDRSPLKHTVDVAPMSTTVIEFYTDEPGDWFFHCHLLYHMMNGMARVVHYEGFTAGPDVAGLGHLLHEDPWYMMGEVDILSSMTHGSLTLSDTFNILKGTWEAGWQKVDKTEWEGIVTWERYVNQFFTCFAGADLLGEGDELDESRGVVGCGYLLPLSLESRLWVDTDGGMRFSLEKSLNLTPRLALNGEIRYDTHDKWEGSAGLSWMLGRDFSLIGRWHSHYGFGGGLQVRF
jgi:hypothetical protein